MSKLRMQAGVDIWLCGVCHQWQVVGKKCKCGRTNADELCDKAKAEKVCAKNAQTTRKKPRPPKAETQFTKSYFFPKDGEK